MGTCWAKMLLHAVGTIPVLRGMSCRTLGEIGGLCDRIGPLPRRCLTPPKPCHGRDPASTVIPYGSKSQTQQIPWSVPAATGCFRLEPHAAGCACFPICLGLQSLN